MAEGESYDLSISDLESEGLPINLTLYMAGSEEFESPDRSSRSTVFKTAALNHSANSPCGSDGRTRTYDRQGISLELLPAELHHYINELRGFLLSTSYPLVLPMRPLLFPYPQSERRRMRYLAWCGIRDSNPD